MISISPIWRTQWHNCQTVIDRNFWKWIALHLFNDDTCSSGHNSRPSQVEFSHNCLSSISRLQSLPVFRVNSSRLCFWIAYSVCQYQLWRHPLYEYSFIFVLFLIPINSPRNVWRSHICVFTLCLICVSNLIVALGWSCDMVNIKSVPSFWLKFGKRPWIVPAGYIVLTSLGRKGHWWGMRGLIQGCTLLSRWLIEGY